MASGKTTVGRELASRLDYIYLDTGIMYRAVTWLALRNHLDIRDEEALGKLAQENPVNLIGQDSNTVQIQDYQLGSELRDPEVNKHVSQVSLVPAVRRALVAQQRELAGQEEIVMVGRDITTVVMPNAGLKIFLSAPPEDRAQRRWKEMQDQGRDVHFVDVLKETVARDEMDSQREDSPLVQAEDALLVETKGLSVDQVVEKILSKVRRS